MIAAFKPTSSSSCKTMYWNILILLNQFKHYRIVTVLSYCLISEGYNSSEVWYAFNSLDRMNAFIEYFVLMLYLYLKKKVILFQILFYFNHYFCRYTMMTIIKINNRLFRKIITIRRYMIDIYCCGVVYFYKHNE